MCRVTISVKTAVKMGPSLLRALNMKDVNGSRACCKSCLNQGYVAYASLKRASNSDPSTPIRPAKVQPVLSVLSMHVGI